MSGATTPRSAGGQPKVMTSRLMNMKVSNHLRSMAKELHAPFTTYGPSSCNVQSPPLHSLPTHQPGHPTNTLRSARSCLTVQRPPHQLAHRHPFQMTAVPSSSVPKAARQNGCFTCPSPARTAIPTPLTPQTKKIRSGTPPAPSVAKATAPSSGGRPRWQP